MDRQRRFSRRRMMAIGAASVVAGGPVRSDSLSEAAGVVRIGERKVHYHRSGQGPAVVLIHGASGNFRDWTFAVAGELSKTFEVIAFDRPGLGLSDPAADEVSLAAQAGLMRIALRDLGMTRYTLVGHSYGGSVALRWALDQPGEVTGLAIFSAPSHPWPGPLDFHYRWANTPLAGWLIANIVPAFASRARVEEAIASIFAPQPVPAGYVDHICFGLSLRRRVFHTNAKQVGALYPQVVEMSGRYSDLKVPVEIVHGDADTIVPAQIHSDRLANAIPQARYTRIAGMGHAPHNADPEQAVQTIKRLF